MNDTTHEHLTDEAIMQAARDNEAVDAFAQAMKEKLAIARAKGRGGWDDKETCSDEHLARCFFHHLNKENHGNFTDLANFLMFLHVRGARSDILSEAIVGIPKCARL